jgi:hypothetical protein
MNTQFGRMWNKAVVAISPEGTEKNHENPNRDSWCPGRESNQAPLERKLVSCLYYFSNYKMEATRSSETSVHFRRRETFINLCWTHMIQLGAGVMDFRVPFGKGIY